jgi:hypothetical protein
METVARVRDVSVVDTRTGKKRYEITDSRGRKYTTFRTGIGERAAEFQGRQARIEYHEEQRGQFLNVYLDAIEPADEETVEPDGQVDEADEAGWKAAIEAAPWLVGDSEPSRAVPPKEFFDRLKPFKDLVSDDINEMGATDQDASEGSRS